MRVGERASSQVRAEAAQGGAFADALRRARGADPRGARAPARAEPRKPTGRTDPVRPAGGEGGPEAAPVAAAARAASGPDGPPGPELAALARTLPAVVAAGTRRGEPLALSFGRSLHVELRAGAAGVELLLRPEPRLARIVEAELPRLLAAMRSRGVAVARAEVRARGGAARRAR